MVRLSFGGLEGWLRKNHQWNAWCGSCGGCAVLEETRAELTPMQQTVLECIQTHYAERGRAPTVRELGSDLDRTVNAVAGHLKKLEELGYLEREPNAARGLKLV